MLEDGPSAVEDVVADLVARRRARAHRDGIAAVLRLRHRRRAPGRRSRPTGSTSTWDQNAGPRGAVARRGGDREVAGAWVLDLLGLPADASFAFVTGCQMAHVTALAAARHRVLADAGHDVERDGLAGAPPIRVLAGEERHVTLDRALRFLGLGARHRSCPSRSTRPARCAPARSATRCGPASAGRPSSPRRRAT